MSKDELAQLCYLLNKFEVSHRGKKLDTRALTIVHAQAWDEARAAGLDERTLYRLATEGVFPDPQQHPAAS